MSKASICLCVIFLALATNVRISSAEGPINYPVSSQFTSYSQKYDKEMNEEVLILAHKADAILRSTVETVWQSSYVQFALKVPLVKKTFDCVSKQMKPTNAHMSEMVRAIVRMISHIRALNIEVGTCFANAQRPGAPKTSKCINDVTGGAAQAGIEAQQRLVLNFVRVYRAFKVFVNTVNNCVSQNS